MSNNIKKEDYEARIAEMETKVAAAEKAAEEAKASEADAAKKVAELENKLEEAASKLVESENSGETVSNPADAELVDLFVPRGQAGDESSIVIGVNGKFWQLPRGKTSSVPPSIANEYHRSEKAEDLMNEHIAEMLEMNK